MAGLAVGQGTHMAGRWWVGSVHGGVSGGAGNAHGGEAGNAHGGAVVGWARTWRGSGGQGTHTAG